MSCGMVPDGLAFQLGRNGVSLTLSFLSLRHWSISSSQLLAGALIPAWASIGSLYMRTNRLVKYGSPRSFEPSLLLRLSRLAGGTFPVWSSPPGRGSPPAGRAAPRHRPRLFVCAGIPAPALPGAARVSPVA